VLDKGKKGILRAKKGVYLTKIQHLTKCLTMREKRLFLSLFLGGKVFGNEKLNRKKVFHSKKNKKIF